MRVGRLGITLLALMVTTGMAAGSASAREILPSPRMVADRPVPAPRGFVAMCAETPASCARPAADYAIDDGADADLKLLEKINKRVNGRVRQVSDQALYGRAEYWRRSGIAAGAKGDCEDLAIEKREELIEAGFPAERLFYAIAYQRQAGLHAVLVAQTDEGDFVLDSRTPYVTPWQRTPYFWLSRQSATDPMRWNQIAQSAAADRFAGVRSEGATSALDER